MEAQERIETRKDEIRYRTADQRRMVGKFLAGNVCKKWVEDFADKETGEVISVERTSILFENGKYIDEETAQSICFHIQCGDIADVEVSNQRRIARTEKSHSLRPYTATAVITAWLNMKMKKTAEEENREPRTFEVSLTAAQPFSLNAIIPYAFCAAYKEVEKITITTD